MLYTFKLKKKKKNRRFGTGTHNKGTGMKKICFK